jgi:adenine phosphoribosyltransferase
MAYRAGMTRRASDLKALVRTVPDFPRPGIMFRDITTLLRDPEGFGACVERLAETVAPFSFGRIVGIESRGFIIGAALAHRLGRGFVPIRKPGKLPAENFGHDYELEYGTDRVEMHADALDPGEHVLLVDDLLATGGTAVAACRLIEMARANVSACAFLIELEGLPGRDRLAALPVPVVATLAFPAG